MKEQQTLPVGADTPPPVETTEYLYIYPKVDSCRPGVGEVLTRSTFSIEDFFNFGNDEEFLVIKLTRIGGLIAEATFHAAVTGAAGLAS